MQKLLCWKYVNRKIQKLRLLFKDGIVNEMLNLLATNNTVPK